MPVVVISRQSGSLEETPDVITKGFVLDARTEALLKEIPTLLAATIESANVEERTDPGSSRRRFAWTCSGFSASVQDSGRSCCR